LTRAWPLCLLPVMSMQSFRYGAKERVARFHNWYVGKWWLVWIIGPLLVAFPAQLLLVGSFHAPLKTWLEDADNQAWLWVFALSPILLSVAKSVIDKIAFSFANPVGDEQLIALLRILNEVVARKAERFFRTLEEVRNSPKSHGEIFTVITRPDAQIERLVEGVWQFFNRSSDKNAPVVRVVLAEMGPQHILNYRLCYPVDKQPRTRIADLQRSDSGFSVAKSTRRILIVEDVEKESRSTRKSRFVSTSDDTTGAGGSLVCWPVVCERLDEVPFVLSLYAPRRGFFRTSEEQMYRYVLEMFTRRLVLEYGLEQLKLKGAK
jgi:hypothetical protein